MPKVCVGQLPVVAQHARRERSRRWLGSGQGSGVVAAPDPLASLSSERSRTAGAHMSEHSCYACGEGNAERIVTAGDDQWELRFPERFTSRNGFVNGGIAVGTLACPALDAATYDGATRAVATRITGRLTAPVPGAKPLRATVERAEGSYEVTVVDGETTVMTGVVEVADLHAGPGAVLQDLPHAQVEHVSAMVRLSDANPQGPTYFERMRERGDEDQIPGCFSCGPDQDRGLRIIPRLAGDREVWAHWRPEPSFTDGAGVLAAAVAASALDCSSGLVFQFDDELAQRMKEEGRGAIPVLGSLDIRVLRVPPVAIEGDYRVLARRVSHEGRKLFGLSGLFDRDGITYATAEATWLTINRRR